MDVVEVAHRCYAGKYPENTVKAAAMATSQEGYAAPDVVELDVQQTRDGKVIVFHDEDLRKHGARGLTEISGHPTETAWSTIRCAEVLGSGETVPLLEDVLEVIPSSVDVNVEFKDVADDRVSFRWGEGAEGLGCALDPDEIGAQREVWMPFVSDVFAVLDRYDNRFRVSSFFEGAVAAAREAGEVPAAFLCWESPQAGLTVAERHDLDWLYVPLDMLPGTPFFNRKIYTNHTFPERDVIKEAYENGYGVYAWTVNTWYEADQAVRAGVDGIIANYPGLLTYTRETR